MKAGNLMSVPVVTIRCDSALALLGWCTTAGIFPWALWILGRKD